MIMAISQEDVHQLDMLIFNKFISVKDVNTNRRLGNNGFKVFIFCRTFKNVQGNLSTCINISHHLHISDEEIKWGSNSVSTA